MTTDRAAPALDPGRTRRPATPGRSLVAAAAAIVFGWLGLALLVRPGGWSQVIELRVVPLVIAGAAFTVFGVAFVVRRRRDQPPLAVRDGIGLVAVPALPGQLVVAAQVLLAPLLLSQAFYAWGSTDGSGHGARWVLTVCGGLAYVGAGIAAVTAVGGLPRLELTPEAVVLHDVFGVGSFPWASLDPTGPARLDERHRLTLVIARPELIVSIGMIGRRQRRGESLWPATADLVEAVSTYVDDPRRLIGADRAVSGPPTSPRS